MAKPKTQLNDASVDAFLEGIDDGAKRADAVEVCALMAEASGCPPRMWGKSIVGFGSYHYVYASGREGDWMRIGLSPRKTALTLYIMPGLEAYGGLLERLGKHKTGKSCLYVKRLDDIDRVVLRELVEASLAQMERTYPTD